MLIQLLSVDIAVLYCSFNEINLKKTITEWRTEWPCRHVRHRHFRLLWTYINIFNVKLKFSTWRLLQVFKAKREAYKQNNHHQVIRGIVSCLSWSILHFSNAEMVFNQNRNSEKFSTAFKWISIEQFRLLPITVPFACQKQIIYSNCANTTTSYNLHQWPVNQCTKWMFTFYRRNDGEYMKTFSRCAIYR